MALQWKDVDSSARESLISSLSTDARHFRETANGVSRPEARSYYQQAADSFEAAAEALRKLAEGV